MDDYRAVAEDVVRRLGRRYAGGEVVRAATGASGAAVYRVGGEFLKISGVAEDVAAEAERARWLAAQGIPVGEVVEAGERDGVGWLLTRAVDGVSAADWAPDDLDSVVDGMAEATAFLHSLPVGACPFRRDLDLTVPAARHQVTTGAVSIDDLEPQYAGWSADRLLAELERTRPATEDLVVCHGDLTPENLLLDPATGRLAGFVDVARLGVGDRWVDLAVAHRDLGDEPFGPGDAERFLTSYGVGADPAKLAFYVLLDEFF